MRIGTDMSLKVCLEEGYTVMDFKARELFPHGRKNGMDKDCFVTFSASIPAYRRKELATGRDPFGMRRLWEASASWNSLLELYLPRKASVDSSAGGPQVSDMENPDEYDMLNLGDVLQAYCGLD